jgi:hypothetical protein
MVYGPLKRGPRTDDPLNKQFKIRCKEADLKTIERLARDGVTLPERTIAPGTNKSELVRQALGLADPPDTTPGANALDELTRRVKRG